MLLLWAKLGSKWLNIDQALFCVSLDVNLSKVCFQRSFDFFCARDPELLLICKSHDKSKEATCRRNRLGSGRARTTSRWKRGTISGKVLWLPEARKDTQKF